VSHKPGGRLPLLSARPAVTPETLKRAIGTGRILKVEGHSGGRLVIISAQSAEKIFWCPPLFSCAHPVFDRIRGTTIKVKQF